MPRTTNQVNVRFPEELMKLVKDEAEKEFTSSSEIVKRAVVFYLKQKEVEK